MKIPEELLPVSGEYPLEICVHQCKRNPIAIVSGFCKEMHLRGYRHECWKVGAWQVKLSEGICRRGTIRMNYVSKLSEIRTG